MSQDGAMLGGYLLPEAQFKELMEKIIIENSNLMIQYLQNVLTYIATGDVKQAYLAWDKFWTEFLQNPTTSLMTILNLNFEEQHNEFSFAFVDDEANAVLKRGAINMKAVGDGLKREYNSQILTQHLSNLYTEVTSAQMEPDEIQYLYDLKRNEIYKNLNPIKYGNKAYIYQKAIYGRITGKYLNGKIADAYVNHIGATHWEVFNNFSQTGVLMDDDLAHASVKLEERARGSLNFVKLLMASQNRTAWYSGGDLIITAPDGQVVASIQLKASGGEGAWVGNIRTKTLERQIKNILSEIQTDAKKSSVRFYEMLKTSSASEQLGDAVIAHSYRMVEEIFKLK